MYKSKIQELGESSFRDPRGQSDLRLNIKRNSSAIQSRLIPQASPSSLNDLKDYVMQLPHCSYHHRPIRFLCVSPTCNCSFYGLCIDPQCRQLHSDPDSDLIDLQVFNSVVANNCSPLLLLANKVRGYYDQLKKRLMHEIEKSASRAQYLLQSVYTGQVPRLIRQKQCKEITSKKLAYFIKRDISQNNPQQRKRVESLRNQIVNSVSQFQSTFSKLLDNKDYQKLILKQNLEPPLSFPQGNVLNQVDVSSMQSGIMEFLEDKQILVRLLKQNRAPHFTKLHNIFKASDHLFNAFQYHKAIQGSTPTVTVVRTTSGARFGVFLNCKITQKEEWICDASGLSFIFSLDRGQAFKLKPQAVSRVKAAFGGTEGPQIGSGCDLYIMDKCNKGRVNGANLGGSYRLPPHLEFNTPQARSYLAGEEFFIVSQYQVFLLA